MTDEERMADDGGTNEPEPVRGAFPSEADIRELLDDIEEQEGLLWRWSAYEQGQPLSEWPPYQRLRALFPREG